MSTLLLVLVLALAAAYFFGPPRLLKDRTDLFVDQIRTQAVLLLERAKKKVDGFRKP